MVCRRASALILVSALFACSREPPPPAPPAPEGGATASAPAPSSSPPPIVVSPLITLSTVDPHNYPAYPVSIPGVLTIRAPALDSQSHGFGVEPWKATFLV